MIIDSHEHLMLPIKNQIKKLDESGIDKAILFCTAPHPEKASSFSELINEMNTLYKILDGNNTKEANIQRLKINIEEVVQAIQQYPDRFYGFGAVPLGLALEDTKKWIAKNIVDNGLKGIGEFTPGSDEEICKLETVFQVLEQFPGLPVWVHTFHPVSLKGIRILMNLTRKYSKTPVIYGHMGGYYWMDVIEFVRITSNAFIDLSGTFSSLAVRMAILEVPEKCLFSSDAPYGEPVLNKQLIEFVCPSKSIASMVFGENILRLISAQNDK
ncbi:MAG: amidohydrolase family protein [Lachnospiraceae bacterium]|nr:amidohydrolase family protein [Lachnospiraceae bacterium]